MPFDLAIRALPCLAMFQGGGGGGGGGGADDGGDDDDAGGGGGGGFNDGGRVISVSCRVIGRTVPFRAIIYVCNCISVLIRAKNIS